MQEVIHRQLHVSLLWMRRGLQNPFKRDYRATFVANDASGPASVHFLRQALLRPVGFP